MTPKRYFTFGCLTLLIQSAVLASQNSRPDIQLSAGSVMGSNQAVTVSIAMQASQTKEKIPRADTDAKQLSPKIKKSVHVSKSKPVVKPTSIANTLPIETPKAIINEVAKVRKIDRENLNTKKATESVAHNQLQVEAKQGASKQSVALNKPTFSVPPAQPHYPKKARERGFQGTATIEVMFDQVGQQLSLTLVDSSGYRLLDKAALTAVEKWQFSAPSPQTAYAYTVRVPVKFMLN